MPFPASYALMVEIARTAKAKMLISVNDVPAKREAFAGLPAEQLELTYAVCAGRRQDEESRPRGPELVMPLALRLPLSGPCPTLPLAPPAPANPPLTLL